MTFEENPFRVLGVSIYDTKATIIERADDLSFADPNREKIFNQARDILINPRKRIAAEMRWFVGCSRRMEQGFTIILINSDFDNDEYDDEYSSYLADLNFYIYSLECKIDKDDISTIDWTYSKLNVEEIRKQINAARLESKFPIVNDTNIIKAEIRNIRNDLCGIVQDRLKSIINV